MTAAHRHLAVRPPTRRGGARPPRFVLRPLALALAGGSLLSLPTFTGAQVAPPPVLPSGLTVVQGPPLSS